MRWLAATVAVIALAACGSSSKHLPTTAPTAGAVFVDSAGGFSARFPAKPRVVNEPSSIGSVHLDNHLAVAKSADGVTEAEVTDVTPALKSAAFTANLVAAVKAVTSTSDLSLKGAPTSTQFDGHAAERADYTDGSGQRYRSVAFFPRGSKLVLLIAPASDFSSFAASFALR